MPHQDHYITIGKIGATHGVKGFLKIYSYSDDNRNISDYQPWYLSDATHKNIPITIESAIMHHEQLLVKLAGIHTPEEARLYTGKSINIKRSQLPPLKKDEYYWSDLIGMTVYDQNQKILGIVRYLIATGANDALVVQQEGQKEMAIPFLLNRTILSVNLNERTIHVDWEPI